MRVVQLVYDCLPNAGSDPGIGWQAVVNAAESHEVIALTKASNREAIEAAGPIDNVTWHFVDLREEVGRFSTGSSLGDTIHNYFWLRKARKLTERLLKATPVDLTHYVTFSAFWMPVPFADLGVPHVFGPVSGGETVPARLMEGQPSSFRRSERIRSILQSAGMRTPSWRRMAESPTTLMVAASETTARRMRAAGARNVDVWRVGFSLTEDLVEHLNSIERRYIDGQRVLVCSGRQLTWKGHDLAVRSFAIVAERSPDVRLVVIGDGPCHQDLVSLAESLGLSERIDFLPDADREAERTIIAKSTAFLFPSRRDSGSTLLPLTQVLGVPIVAFDTGAVREVTGGHASLGDLSTDRSPPEILAAATLDVLEGMMDIGPMIQSGRAHALEIYGEDSAKSALADWYQRLSRR